MDGKVPEIYWYVFWVGFVVISFGGMILGGMLQHRQRMKSLEILRTYAEKGVNLPPEAFDAMLQHGQGTPRAAARKAEGVEAGVSAGVHLGQFVGSLFAAGLTGGVAWWVTQSHGPEWLFYGAVIVSIACTAGAVARLTAAIVTREK